MPRNSACATWPTATLVFNNAGDRQRLCRVGTGQESPCHPPSENQPIHTIETPGHSKGARARPAKRGMRGKRLLPGAAHGQVMNARKSSVNAVEYPTGIARAATARRSREVWRLLF